MATVGKDRLLAGDPIGDLRGVWCAWFAITGAAVGQGCGGMGEGAGEAVVKGLKVLPRHLTFDGTVASTPYLRTGGSNIAWAYGLPCGTGVAGCLRSGWVVVLIDRHGCGLLRGG